jgi:hypothetical protein
MRSGDGALDILRDLGGCAGGQVVYRAADAALVLRHPVRTRRRLGPETAARLQPLFPEVDLRGVTTVTDASLPAAWFKSGTLAMTFGSRMWFKWNSMRVEETDEGLRLLMHELVHVAQFRRLGSSKAAFACTYGKGYLRTGSYAANPLEAEAFHFVNTHPLPPAGPLGY